LESREELESARETLADLTELFQTHHDLHSCLENPAIQVAYRENVLDEILRRTEAMGAVKALMHEMLERGRIALLPQISEVFTEEVDDRLNQTSAVATSAAPLTQAQRQQLVKSLEAYAGKNVRLLEKVDPDVIGGVVVRMGGYVLDGSVRTRLMHMKESLLAQEI
jgi:F-type H+-transporting ATPase subunit delta